MSKNLTTVASFSTPIEAHMAKARLDSAGIFATINDEHIVSLNWFYSDLVGGVKIKVLEEELQDARSILELDVVKAAGERENQGSREACPECAGLDVEYISDKRGFFLSWLFVGFPFFSLRDKMKCRACEHIWKYKG